MLRSIENALLIDNLIKECGVDPRGTVLLSNVMYQKYVYYCELNTVNFFPLR